MYPKDRHLGSKAAQQVRNTLAVRLTLRGGINCIRVSDPPLDVLYLVRVWCCVAASSVGKESNGTMICCACPTGTLIPNVSVADRNPACNLVADCGPTFLLVI